MNIILEKGLSACATTVVGAEKTARAMGSGDLDVFATPAMAALMEQAAARAVAGALPEGATTVGAEISVTHLRPSAPGAEIVATAVVTAVEGRKIAFAVGACDGSGAIGEGTHVRYVVDRTKFLARLK